MKPPQFPLLDFIVRTACRLDTLESEIAPLKRMIQQLVEDVHSLNSMQTIVYK